MLILFKKTAIDRWSDLNRRPAKGTLGYDRWRPFAVHAGFGLWRIYKANSEHPDQTARMRWVIWVFAVQTYPKALFAGPRAPLLFNL